MTSIHMDTFQRPAPYWLRRAEKCKQAGDLRRAAVLERHAARTDPGYAARPGPATRSPSGSCTATRPATARRLRLWRMILRAWRSTG